MLKMACTANKRRSPNVEVMLGRRRRRRANINPTLGEWLVFAGRWAWDLLFTTKALKSDLSEPLAPYQWAPIKHWDVGPMLVYCRDYRRRRRASNKSTLGQRIVLAWWEVREVRDLLLIDTPSTPKMIHQHSHDGHISNKHTTKLVEFCSVLAEPFFKLDSIYKGMVISIWLISRSGRMLVLYI